jgi:hypothetical protein
VLARFEECLGKQLGVQEIGVKLPGLCAEPPGLETFLLSPRPSL